MQQCISFVVRCIIYSMIAYHIIGCGTPSLSEGEDGSQLHALRMGNILFFLATVSAHSKHLLSEEQLNLANLEDYFLFIICPVKNIYPDDHLSRMLAFFQKERIRTKVLPKNCISAFQQENGEATLLHLSTVASIDGSQINDYLHNLSLNNPKALLKSHISSFAAGSALPMVFNPALVKSPVLNLKHIIKGTGVRYHRKSLPVINEFLSIMLIAGGYYVTDQSLKHLDETNDSFSYLQHQNENQNKSPQNLQNLSSFSLASSILSGVLGFFMAQSLIKRGMKIAGHRGALLAYFALPSIAYFIGSHLHIPSHELLHSANLKDALSVYKAFSLGRKQIQTIDSTLPETIAQLGAAMQYEQQNDENFASYCLPTAHPEKTLNSPECYPIVQRVLSSSSATDHQSHVFDASTIEP